MALVGSKVVLSGSRMSYCGSSSFPMVLGGLGLGCNFASIPTDMKSTCFLHILHLASPTSQPVYPPVGPDTPGGSNQKPHFHPEMHNFLHHSKQELRNYGRNVTWFPLKM